MIHIETIELGSSQASITFSSIPQEYTDLKILVSARSDRTSADGDEIQMQLNSESSSSIVLYGTGSGVSTYSVTDDRVAFISGDNVTANTFNNASIYISNYTSTNNKSVSSDSVWENNATRADQALFAFLSTSSEATTSITLNPRVGTNFLAGSTFSLYGITAGSDGTTTVT